MFYELTLNVINNLRRFDSPLKSINQATLINLQQIIEFDSNKVLRTNHSKYIGCTNLIQIKANI